MTRTQEHTHPPPQPVQTTPADRHPAWCDPAEYAADPAGPARDYRPGAGGEHRSAPIPLALSPAGWLPVRDGAAWLSEASAPWPCSPYLRVQVADVDLSLPVDDAAPVPDALSTLLASAATAAEVTR